METMYRSTLPLVSFLCTLDHYSPGIPELSLLSRGQTLFALVSRRPTLKINFPSLAAPDPENKFWRRETIFAQVLILTRDDSNCFEQPAFPMATDLPSQVTGTSHLLEPKSIVNQISSGWRFRKGAYNLQSISATPRKVAWFKRL